jgi:putative tryptophan/tyrosine transport system substrate-binding protein
LTGAGSSKSWPVDADIASAVNGGDDRLMDRRAFVGSLALVALASQRPVLAQPGRKMYRIGILSSRYSTSEIAGPQPRDPHVVALLSGLRKLGYVYGQHFLTEPRGGEGKPERYPNLAAELVRRQVDVIVAGGPMLAAAKQATSTIPVVMGGAGDPVLDGFVQSLGRPGGNFTGLSLQLVDSTAKRLELIKELVPGAAPVAVLWSRLNPSHSLAWQAAESVARERGWNLISLEIRHADEIEAAFKAATAARAGGLFVHPTGHLDRHARRIAELAAKSRLPAIYGLRFYVESGGLMFYGADTIDIWRRAAVFVDKILNGAKATDLAVEQPTKFELVINLIAARSIGLTIPQQVLLRADEIVQ